MDSITGTILTSAAVAAVVSSAMNLIGQRLERRSRREELVFSKALDLAEQRLQLGMALLKADGTKTIFPQAVILAAEYRQYLSVLLKDGALPREYLDKHAAETAKQLGGSK
jgi:hypothetical protein